MLRCLCLVDPELASVYKTNNRSALQLDCTAAISIHIQTMTTILALIAGIATAAAASASTINATQDTPNPDMQVRPNVFNFLPSNVSTIEWYDKNRGYISPDLAKLQIKANVPSIILDKVPGFVNITCTQTTATASFYHPALIAQWQREPTLLLLSSHHNCTEKNPMDFSMLLAKSWSIRNDSVVFETADPEASGVKASFDVDATPVIGKYDEERTSAETAEYLDRGIHIPETVSRCLFSDCNFAFASLVPGILVAQSRIAPFGSLISLIAPSTLLKSIADNLLQVVPFVTDTKLYGMLSPLTRFKSGGSLGLLCKPCTFRTNSVFTIHIEGTFFPFNFEYTIDWSGSMSTIHNVVWTVSKPSSYAPPIRKERKAFNRTLNVFNQTLNTFKQILKTFKQTLNEIKTPFLTLTLDLEYKTEAIASIMHQLKLGMVFGLNAKNFKIHGSRKHGLIAEGLWDPILTNVIPNTKTTGSITFKTGFDLAIKLDLFSMKDVLEVSIGVGLTQYNQIWMDNLERTCVASGLNFDIDFDYWVFSESIPIMTPMTFLQNCTRIS